MESNISYEKYQALVKKYGAEAVLNDLLKALNSEELEENLEFLCKGYDIEVEDL